MKTTNTFILLLLLSTIFYGQGVSIVPTEIPNSVIGSWENSKNEVVLIVSQDYVIIQNKLFYYNDIVKEDNTLNFTAVYNSDVKYFSIKITDNSNILLDESFKVSQLKKNKTKTTKLIPKNMIGNWYSSRSKLEIFKTQVYFSKDEYQIDQVVNYNSNKQHIVLYKDAEYYYNYAINNDNGHFLQTSINNEYLFKKESFLRKYKTLIGVFIIFLLLIAGYILFKWKLVLTKKKETAKRKFTEMQLKSFRSQMNPHFLFNALSAIQNLINKGDNEKANHYLTEFSQLMRLTLDKSEKGLIPLSDEIKSMTKYLELEKLRFHFNYSINSDINSDEIEIPAMLIQPFVENAIIHGLKESEGDKNLSITFKVGEEILCCFIEDNGIGFNASQAKKSSNLNRTPYGLKLAKDRLNLINENYKTNAKINISDISEKNRNETGTLVEIRLPLLY